MKKHTIVFFALLIFVSLACWYGCQKAPGVAPAPPDPLKEKVNASVSGRVIDENGLPVKDAAISAGGNSTTTDINGFFRFSNIQLSTNAGFVSVEKKDYFKTGRSIFTNAGVVNNIEVRLIPKKLRGSFQVAAGGNISIEGGSAVSFLANGIINSSTKQVYTGTVNVFGAFLNPEDSHLSAIMPGNLTGINLKNEQKILQTFGMLGIELEGSNGEKLNLASGKTATITMPIVSSLQASAPATIPLWYFSDSLGSWKEEGVASRQGNIYSGTVTHFSFWNCDVPNDFVTLQLTLKNQQEAILAGYRVELRNTQNNATSFGYTDSVGMVKGAVPPNITIEMKVFNKCNTLLKTQSIGPFNSTTNLGVVSVTTPATGTIVVSGTIKKCNLAPVTNGFVNIGIDNNNYSAALVNGNYSITISRCGTDAGSLNLVAFDLDAKQQSNTVTATVTTGNVTVNASACGATLEQYMNFTIGGSAFNFTQGADSLVSYRSGNVTNCAGSHYSGDSINFKYASFNFEGSAVPGTYNMVANTVIVTRGIPSSVEYAMDGAITVTVTEYGAVGGFIAGSFNGNFKERTTNAVVAGSCSFRVKRLQ